jgi:ABC-type sulfate transport system permease subunit
MWTGRNLRWGLIAGLLVGGAAVGGFLQGAISIVYTALTGHHLP